MILIGIVKILNHDVTYLFIQFIFCLLDFIATIKELTIIVIFQQKRINVK